MKTYTSYSVQETEALAARLAKTLKGGEVIAFTGGMGAGKTAFTRGLVKGLGGGDVVSSPTFAIRHEYAARLSVKHFDMYRITGYDDLYFTGFFEDQDDEESVLLIEWSENIREFLPQDCIHVSLERGEDEDSRKIHITGWEDDHDHIGD